MTYFERMIECDLDIKEVAMVIHRFLKRLDIRFQNININVEKVNYDVIDIKDDENLISVERYTVIMLASVKQVSSKEIMKEYEKIQSDGFKIGGRT